MPKNKLLKQTSKKSFDSFNCMNAPKEEITEIEISAPVQLSKEELQLIDEIIKNIPIIEGLKLEKNQEQHLLSLMRSIKKFSEKSSKSHDELKALNGMIAMYKEKKIEWNKHVSTESESSKGSIEAQSTVSKNLTFDQNNEEKSFSISPKTESLIFLNKLKPLITKINFQKKAEHSPQFFLDKETLSKIKLKSISSDDKKKQNLQIDNLVQSELEQVLAVRRTVSEGEDASNLENVLTKEERLIRTDTITSKKELVDSDNSFEPAFTNETSDPALPTNTLAEACQHSSTDEAQYPSLSTIFEEDSQRSSSISLANYEIYINQMPCDINRNSVSSLKGFEDLEAAIKLLDQNSAKKLPTCNNDFENGTQIDKLEEYQNTFFKTPIQVNESSNNNKPRIVGEIIKLKI